jgi:beta-phosphoglucomutase-like phosphatase (HAD superfamily)
VADDAQLRAKPAADRVARPLSNAILDVDGVLLASPHERAWREALTGLADPARFTTAMYQGQVAGKPRLSGATAALQALGVADAVRLAPAYGAAKQARLEALIAQGGVAAFLDGLRFVQALRTLRWPIAVASSSKNANTMMRTIPMDPGQSLIDMFTVNVCGRELTHGKPDPEIFQMAAKALGAPASKCVVVEDAPAGVEAARAGGMSALGVARLDDAAGLWAAGADLVVASLDEVSIEALAHGRLCRTTA